MIKAHDLCRNSLREPRQTESTLDSGFRELRQTELTLDSGFRELRQAELTLNSECLREPRQAELTFSSGFVPLRQAELTLDSERRTPTAGRIGPRFGLRTPTAGRIVTRFRATYPYETYKSPNNQQKERLDYDQSQCKTISRPVNRAITPPRPSGTPPLKGAGSGGAADSPEMRMKNKSPEADALSGITIF